MADLSAPRAGELLYLPGDSPVHRLHAQCKLIGLLAFIVVVVGTPPTAYPAFAGYALLAVSLVALAGLPPGTVARRMLVETPFVVFALVLPFVASGPKVELVGFRLSEAGLVGGWNILAKATLGVVTAIVLAATTPPRDLLAGLERLRVPGQLVGIAAFMLRYLELIGDAARRMRIAQVSRGLRATSPRSWPAIAGSLGALFIRSYERGERVHLAMLSRGHTGNGSSLPMPAGTSVAKAGALHWSAAFGLPALAAAIGLVAVGSGWM